MGHGVNQRAQIKMTPEEIDGFLAERRPVSLCSINHDGSIHAVAMWYGFLDGMLAFETKAKSQKAQNLRRDPRMTCMAEDGDYYEELRGVELVGTAEFIDDPDRMFELGVNLFERYYGTYTEELRPSWRPCSTSGWSSPCTSSARCRGTTASWGCPPPARAEPASSLEHVSLCRAPGLGSAPMILDRFRLTDRAAIVTGAGRGIGAATAVALAEAGADVVIAARTEEQLLAVAKQIEAAGRRAVVVPADLNDLDVMAQLVDKATDTFGRLDIIVNNHGGWMPRPLLDVSPGHLERAFRYNVSSAHALVRAAVPAMLEGDGGAVVNISSMAGRVAPRGFTAYATAKAALSHYTRLAAAELAPRIRVNAIAVGTIATSAVDIVVQDAAMLAFIEETALVKRIGQPEDIAACVVYLASPAGDFVTGKIFEIDGGAERPQDLEPRAPGPVTARTGASTYRVVLWGTGNVGRHALAGIDARPDLELVGVWVSNPDKVGRDAGDLAGLGRSLGVAATERRRGAVRPAARLRGAHRHGRPPTARGPRGSREDPARRSQRGVERPGVPAVPRGGRAGGDDRPPAQTRRSARACRCGSTASTPASPTTGSRS